VRHLAEVRPQAPRGSFFQDEGVEADSINALGPETAWDLGVALGTFFSQGRPASERPPTVVIAGDGRAATAAPVATLVEAVRWTGCEAIDAGPASAPCLALAIRRLAADGGVLVGGSHFGPHGVGVRFWTAAGIPLSRGEELDRIQRLAQADADRPARAYGPLRRHQADADYLATLSPEYHAMRPLRVVLDSASGPIAGYLAELTRSVACRILPSHWPGKPLGEQVRDDAAHFGVSIQDDGETCRLWDEQGRAVSSEDLLLLVAQAFVIGMPKATADRPAVILEEDASAECVGRLESLAIRVVKTKSLRGSMARAMREQVALLGGGPSGRLWYPVDGVALPDALFTLTHLLVLLSRSDRPLSAVVSVAPH
jgi:phosphomannomutase